MEIPHSPVRQRAAAKRCIAAGADPLQPVQARSHATRDALFAAGRAMLADFDFDSFSIVELAAASKLSVGSFYGRFRDKEAFFEQLQEQGTAEFLRAARQALLPKDGQASSAGAMRLGPRPGSNNTRHACSTPRSAASRPRRLA